MGDGLLLLFVGPLLRESALGALRDEGWVAAPVRSGGSALEMQDVIDGGCEKGAVVADQEHGAVGRDEVLFEPARGLEIEVIGRLVEQQHLRRAHELARKAEAAKLAARQGRERSRARSLRVELEAV